MRYDDDDNNNNVVNMDLKALCRGLVSAGFIAELVPHHPLACAATDGVTH